MDREEFCKMLVEAKKENGISTSELSFKMKILLHSLKRLENGENSFKIDRVLKYLDSIEYNLVFIKNNKRTVVINYDHIVNYLRIWREKRGISQRSIAKLAGCSSSAIAQNERGDTIMSIDIFLKIADALDIQIKLEKKQ